MDEDAPHQLRWPRVVARVAGAAVLAVVLYVLSYGPALYLFAYRSPELDRAFGEFYRPMSAMIRGIGSPDSIMSYLSWWYDLPGGPTERLLRKGTLLPAVNDLPL